MRSISYSTSRVIDAEARRFSASTSKHDEVEPGELIGDAALAPGTGFGLEAVDEVDLGVKAAAGTGADAVAGNGDGEMRLAGAGAADQHGVALLLQEGAAGEIAHQALVEAINRLFKREGIDRVFHELRDTWIEEARHSPVKREMWEIISGHSGATVSDRYGGEKPDILAEHNETICRFVTGDVEIMAVVHRLTTVAAFRPLTRGRSCLFVGL